MSHSDRFLGLLALSLTLACHAQKLHRPPIGPHQANLEKVVEATFPPPPAQVETIELEPASAPRKSACVWMDGYWDWRADRWQWTPGSWVLPPVACYYAAPELFWMSDPQDPTHPGRLYYRLPSWYPTRTSGTTSSPCSAPLPC